MCNKQQQKKAAGLASRVHAKLFHWSWTLVWRFSRRLVSRWTMPVSSSGYRYTALTTDTGIHTGIRILRGSLNSSPTFYSSGTVRVASGSESILSQGGTIMSPAFTPQDGLFFWPTHNPHRNFRKWAHHLVDSPSRWYANIPWLLHSWAQNVNWLKTALNFT